MRITLICFFFAAIFIFTGNSQINLSDSLVAHFTLDGNTSDNSTLAIDGTNNNATITTGVDNVAGTAYEFNGTSSNIDCGTDNRNITDVVSISAWFRTTMTGNGFIVTKYDHFDRGFHVGINNGTIRFGGRSVSGVYTNTGAGQTIVNDGNWHYLYAEIDGSEWTLYVDCKLESLTSTASSNVSLASSEPLTIGNFNMGDQGDYKYFDGDIDAVRVYNRTLTLDEITMLCTKETYTSIGDEEVSESSEVATDIKFYPNPSKGLVKLKKINGIKIAKTFVYAGNGKKVLSFVGDINQMDISSLKPGVYMVRIFDENNKLLSHKRLSKL